MASLMRRYVDQTTGQALTLVVVCGPPGPIATHNPETCYGGGYDPDNEPARIELPTLSGKPPAPFWVANYHRSRSASPWGLKIYWSWRGDVDPVWETGHKDDVRFRLASYQGVYKVYVIRSVPMKEGRDVEEDKASRQFLQALLPALEACLFGDTTVNATASRAAATGPRSRP